MSHYTIVELFSKHSSKLQNKARAWKSSTESSSLPREAYRTYSFAKNVAEFSRHFPTWRFCARGKSGEVSYFGTHIPYISGTLNRSARSGTWMERADEWKTRESFRVASSRPPVTIPREETRASIANVCITCVIKSTQCVRSLDILLLQARGKGSITSSPRSLASRGRRNAFSQLTRCVSSAGRSRKTSNAPTDICNTPWEYFYKYNIFF